MKNKILTLSLIVALLAIVAGGSLAWFMDDDEATNVFTVGSIEIEQIEQQRDEYGNLEAFVNDKMLLPIVPNNTAELKDDANYQDKIVTVKNIGKNGAWVQTFIAIPKSLDDAGVLHLDVNAGDWSNATLVGTVAEESITGNAGDTLQYNVYRYVYNTVLEKDATTTALLDGLYIDKTADMDIVYDAVGNIVTAHFTMNGVVISGFNANGKLNVYVATQAIQSEGFDSASQALETFATHPWA